MPAPDPIRLGSAVGTGFTFESGSQTSTDQYGIQTCDVNALFPYGGTVFTFMPAEGSSFTSVFGNAYLPSSFLLDFFEGAPQVEYLDGTVARVKFKFKRIDPLFANRRIISVGAVLNYDSQFNQSSFSVIGLGGTASLSLTGSNPNKFGFPEPVVSVKYSTTTAPGIGAGDLSTLYALPGSSKTAGFPAAPDVTVPTTFPVSAGSLVQYFDGTEYIAETPAANSIYTFTTSFKAHPRGWQLTNLKYDPIANQNFFAVEETWRNYYFFYGVTFVNHTP